MLVVFLSVIMTLLNYRADTNPGLVGLKGYPGFAGDNATGPIGDVGPRGPSGASALGTKIGFIGPTGPNTIGAAGPQGPPMSEAPTLYVSTLTATGPAASGDLTIPSFSGLSVIWSVSLDRVQGFKSIDDGLTWVSCVMPFQIHQWASNGKSIVVIPAPNTQPRKIAMSVDFGLTWFSFVDASLLSQATLIVKPGGYQYTLQVRYQLGQQEIITYVSSNGITFTPDDNFVFANNDLINYLQTILLADGTLPFLALSNYTEILGGPHYYFNSDTPHLGSPYVIEHTGLPLFLMNGGLCKLNDSDITLVDPPSTILDQDLESMASNWTQILLVGTTSYFYIASYNFGTGATTSTRYKIPGLIRAYYPMWTGANFVVCAQVASGRSAVHTTYVININGTYTRSNVLSDTELGQPWCPNIWQTRPSNDDLLTALLA